MSVGHEDIAIGRDQNRGRRIELIGTVTALPGVPSVISSLPSGLIVDGLSFHFAADAIGHPDIAFEVDVQAMRENEHAGAERLYQLSGRVELENGIEVRAVAIEYFAFAHLRGRR